MFIQKWFPSIQWSLPLATMYYLEPQSKILSQIGYYQTSFHWNLNYIMDNKLKF